MFTGIVTDIGTIRKVEPRNDVRRLTIATVYDTGTIDLGASIACSGVCLTVVATQPDAFEVEAAPEDAGRHQRARLDRRPAAEPRARP